MTISITPMAAVKTAVVFKEYPNEANALNKTTP